MCRPGPRIMADEMEENTATVKARGTEGRLEAEPEYSGSRQGVAFWLCVFGGLAGLHRFYIRRYASGFFLLALSGCTYVAAGYAHLFSDYPALGKVALLLGLALSGMAADLFVSLFGNTLFSRRFMFIPARTRFSSGFAVPLPGNRKRPHDIFPNPGSVLTYVLLFVIALVPGLGVAATLGGAAAAAFVGTILPGTVAGLLWKGDMSSLRYNSLPDREGRALAP